MLIALQNEKQNKKITREVYNILLCMLVLVNRTMQDLIKSLHGECFMFFKKFSPDLSTYLIIPPIPEIRDFPLKKIIKKNRIHH